MQDDMLESWRDVYAARFRRLSDGEFRSWELEIAHDLSGNPPSQAEIITVIRNMAKYWNQRSAPSAQHIIEHIRHNRKEEFENLETNCEVCGKTGLLDIAETNFTIPCTCDRGEKALSRMRGIKADRAFHDLRREAATAMAQRNQEANEVSRSHAGKGLGEIMNDVLGGAGEEPIIDLQPESPPPGQMTDAATVIAQGRVRTIGWKGDEDCDSREMPF